MSEFIGYNTNDLSEDFLLLEPYINSGGAIELTVCTEKMPTQSDLAQLVLNADRAGLSVNFPTATLVNGVPTTRFAVASKERANLGAGMTTGFVQLLIPLIIPLATIGIVAYGITKISDISNSLIPLVLIVGGVLIVGVALLRKPAENVATRYLEVRR